MTRAIPVTPDGGGTVGFFYTSSASRFHLAHIRLISLWFRSRHNDCVCEGKTDEGALMRRFALAGLCPPCRTAFLGAAPAPAAVVYTAAGTPAGTTGITDTASATFTNNGDG